MNEITTTTAPATEKAAPVAAATPKKAKPAAAKGAKKASAAPAAKPATAAGDLAGNAVKTLAALAKANKPLTRNDLRAKTGINKGWSRLLGAATKDDGGTNAENSLEGKGFVKAERNEGERNLTYTITAAGRKALEKSKAAK